VTGSWPGCLTLQPGEVRSAGSSYPEGRPTASRRFAAARGAADRTRRTIVRLVCSVSAAGDFPVQNGKADFTLSATAAFQPECSPPMTVVFTDVTVTDTTNGLTHSFPGTF
jgi:hypothetical protein